MNPFVKNEPRANWIKLVKILKSGKYTHAKGALSVIGKGNCCLGVVTREMEIPVVGSKSATFEEDRAVEVFDFSSIYKISTPFDSLPHQHNYLPNEVFDEYFSGMPRELSQSGIAGVNDSSISFEPVIQYITEFFDLTPEELA